MGNKVASQKKVIMNNLEDIVRLSRILKSPLDCNTLSESFTEGISRFTTNYGIRPNVALISEKNAKTLCKEMFPNTNIKVLMHNLTVDCVDLRIQESIESNVAIFTRKD